MDPHQPTDFNPYQSPLEQGIPADAASSRPKIPLALKVVAWLLIAQGSLTAIGAVIALFRDSFHFDLTLLLIPAGFGLLKLRRGWRIFTLVVIWLYLITCPLIAVLALFSGTPVNMRVFGFTKVAVPHWVVIPAAVLFFLLFLWQYRVLIRWDVKALFGLHGKRVPRPDEM